MDFVLRTGHQAGEEMRAILLGEINGALESLADYHNEPDLSIHQLRKHNKRIRGITRMVKTGIEKGDLAQVNSLVRDAAKLFADVRDAFVAVQILEFLAGEFAAEVPEGVAGIRDSLEEKHIALRDRREMLTCVEQSEAAFSQVGKAVATWTWERVIASTLLEGWTSNFGKARQCHITALASRDPEDCHDWRKYAKYMSFHCALLGEWFPEHMPAMAAHSEELASWLGEHHDLAVFRDLMHDRSEDVSVWLADQASERQLELEDLAFERGAELYSVTPEEIRRTLEDALATGSVS